MIPLLVPEISPWAWAWACDGEERRGIGYILVVGWEFHEKSYLSEPAQASEEVFIKNAKLQ